MSVELTNPKHRGIVAMLDHALVLQSDPAIWQDFAFVLERRATRFERAMLLATTVAAAHEDDVSEVLGSVTTARSARSPLPILEAAEADARWWTSIASKEELRAYLAACFAHLPDGEQQEFLAAATRMMAA